MDRELVNYAWAFVATLVLETAIAWLLGYRRREELAAVVCVNVFTHPAACFLLWLGVIPADWPWILLLEAGIVLVEWLLLCYALPRKSKARLLALSFMMNAASYLAGLIWFYA
jgi:hypothetical protein